MICAKRVPATPDEKWLEEFNRRFLTVRCSAIRWGGSLITSEQYSADVTHLMQHVRSIVKLEDDHPTT